MSNNHSWFVHIKVDYDNTSGSESNYDGYLNFYLGATELANYSDSTCDFLWKPGNPIYGMQPRADESSQNYPTGAPNPKAALRGTPISVTTGTAKYIFSEG